MTRSVLIVDDERLARERLRDLLGAFEDMSIVGECANGDEAIEAVLASRPDIVFLDVRMPGLDGFGVLEALDDAIDPAAMPVIIFVTAYDQYAMRAFEASALDYVQKPISRHRLAKSVERARRQLDLRTAALAATQAECDSIVTADVSGDVSGESERATRFAVKRGHIAQFIRPDEIDWIDAAGNYVRLHVRGAAYMLRSTISDFGVRLDPNVFVRVHRSAIINLDRVTKVEPFTHGEFVLVTSDGTRLRSSRAHSARLRELLRTGIG